MLSILKFDSQFTFFLASLLPHNQFFNLFFSFFSLRGSSILIWIIIIAALVIFEEKKDKKFIIYFLVTFLATAFLVNIVLKNVFARPRPHFAKASRGKPISTSCPKDYSFPSSHAATAFASAAVLSYFDKKRKWFYYFVASAIAYSRIYLYCHYFGDVIFGAIIGYLIFKLIIVLKNLL